MGDLLHFAPRRTISEMESHVDSIVRHFPPDERYDVAEELIDRARRRGAIDDAQEATLRARFLAPELAPV